MVVEIDILIVLRRHTWWTQLYASNHLKLLFPTGASTTSHKYVCLDLYIFLFHLILFWSVNDGVEENMNLKNTAT